MKAESTIAKEIQLLQRQQEFYVEKNKGRAARSWEADQVYGASEALRWVLGQRKRIGSCNPDYDEAKEKGES